MRFSRSVAAFPPRAIRRSILPGALLGTLLLVGITSAQEDTAPAKTLIEETRALAASVHAASGEIDELEKNLEAATGEDLELAERRVMERKIEALDDLNALSENVLELEKAGEDAGEFRAYAEQLLARIAPAFRPHIEEAQAAAAELRASGEGMAPEELTALQQEINRAGDTVTTLFRSALTHLQYMDKLGVDSDGLRDYLEEALVEHADEVAARVELASERSSDIEERLAATPDDAAVKSELLAAQEKLKGNIDSLSAAVAMLKEVDVETSEYRKLLIQATGDITTDIFEKGVALGLAAQWVDGLRQWLVDNGPGLLFKVLVFVLILLVFRVLAGIVRRLVRRSVSASKLNLSQLLQRMVVNFAFNGVLALGLLVALSQLGFHLGPILAGAGIVGFILGFALQDTLANFAAGLMILIYRPYDVGDLVEAGGVFGKVNKMSLVSTTILTIDNQTLVVPNGKIWGDVIKNVTAQTERRVDMTFGISYSDDIPKAEKVLEAILAEHELVLKDPEPVVRLHTLGESSVDFVVRPWVKTDDYWQVYWDVTREVKMRFDREDISIPFPQRDLHIFEERLQPRVTATAEQAGQRTSDRQAEVGGDGAAEADD
jgi:small conductance mechanosensitive channel